MKSVRRMEVGTSFCPSSRRTFQIHWLKIWQNSWPHGVCENQRSGSCSWSSEACVMRKRAAMQIQMQDIGRSPGMRRDSREELFIDGPVAHHANGRRRGTGRMGRQDRADHRSGGSERNIPAIEERPAGTRFGMRGRLFWRLLQALLDGRQVQQIVLLPAHDHPHPRRSEQIGQRRCIA